MNEVSEVLLCGRYKPFIYCEQVKIKKLHPDAVIPEYQNFGDAGFDFHALHKVEIPGGTAVIVPTGLAMEIPLGHELQIRPRSGMSLKYPLIVANAPGTVDSGYRGEIGIILRNLGFETITIEKGTRIAQGVLTAYTKAGFSEVSALDETDRGAGGFGSTGE